MLPKSYRLKKKNDFRRVYLRGKSAANAELVIYTIKQERIAACSRIGFSVSKKLGGAVERNKIKRRLRAAVRPYLGRLNPEFDIIFIARGKIKGKSFQDVEKSVAALLQRARLLNALNK